MRRNRNQNYSDFIRKNLDVAWHGQENYEVRCRCPLHEDHEPLFSINRRSGKWYCFSCRQGGGVSRLQRLLDQISKQRLETMGRSKFGSAANR